MTKQVIKDLIAFALIIALLLIVDFPLNAALALGVILILSFKGKGIKEELGLAWPANFPRTILMAIALASVILTLSYFVVLPITENLTGRKLQFGIFEQLRGNSSALLGSIAGGWIVGGIIEELIFRSYLIGCVLSSLENKWLTILKVSFSSALFGYMHHYQGPSGQILIAFVGLLLAIIFLVNKKNLWLNIFTHGFVNTISMTVICYYPI